MASASRLAMACFNASRVLSSWTLPSVALYSPSASATVLSSFDDSTAFTADSNAFASAFTPLAVLSALAVASSRPVLSDASHLTMAGVSAPTARLSASRVFTSFTPVASVFNAAVVASAPSSALYDFTVLPRSVTADWHAWRATDTRWFSYALYPHTPPATSATAATAATPMTTGLRFFLPAETVPSTGVDCGMVSGVMLSFSSMTTPSRLRM